MPGAVESLVNCCELADTSQCFQRSQCLAPPNLVLSILAVSDFQCQGLSISTFLRAFPSLTMDLSHAVDNGEGVGWICPSPPTQSPFSPDQPQKGLWSFTAASSSTNCADRKQVQEPVPHPNTENVLRRSLLSYWFYRHKLSPSPCGPLLLTSVPETFGISTHTKTTATLIVSIKNDFPMQICFFFPLPQTSYSKFEPNLL